MKPTLLPMPTVESAMNNSQSVHLQPCLSRQFSGLLLIVGMTLPMAALAVTQARSSAFEYYPNTGLLKKEIIEPNDPLHCVVTEYEYDAFGNKSKTTTRNCNGSSSEAVAPAPGSDAIFEARVTQASYTNASDNTGRFALTITNALNHSEERTYDGRFGTVATLTGPNLLPTTWLYDTFGRKIQENRADGTKTDWAYFQPCDLGVGDLTLANYCVRTISTGSSRAVRTYYDSLNRKLATTRIHFNNSVWVNEGRVEYDAKGRVAKSYQPYIRGSMASAKFTSFEYDELNRVISQTAPDGSVTRQEYAGLTTTITNDLGQTKTVTKNSQGQDVVISDANGKNIHYVYDAIGNLTHTIDSQNNQIVLGYDKRGNKKTMSDPDMGDWSYDYNALGELIRQTDALGQIVTMKYDVLGRMTQRTESDLTSTWEYDTALHGIGKLAVASSDNGYSRSHTYDTKGRLSTTSTVIDNNAAAPYVTQVTYDAASRPLQQIYPTGFAIQNVYDPRGFLKQVVNGVAVNQVVNGVAVNAAPAGSIIYWQADDLDEMNNLKQQTYGNGIVVKQIFDPATGRILQQQAGPNNAVQDMSYTYDTVGNLLTRIDVNSSLFETFAYDTLNRINIATTMSNAVSSFSLFDYDELGNIVYKSDVGGYTYNPTVIHNTQTRTLPHAVGNIAGTMNASYQYDFNGNMTSGGGRSIVWTSFNMPATITNTATATFAQFTYNSEHERVKETQTDGSTVITLSPRYDTGLHFEKRTGGALGTAVEYEHYLYAGGLMFGKYITLNNAAGAVTSTKVEYYHKDHLGSIVAITNEAGVIDTDAQGQLKQYSYDVWGKRRKPNGVLNPPNNPDMYHGYTGHEMLDDLGLVHMNGRMYDPVTARFISADFMLQNPGDMQSYNRYSYVRNHPLSATDPSGQIEFMTMIYFVLAAEAAYQVGIIDKGTARTIQGIAVAAALGPAGSAAETGNVVGQTMIAGFAGSYVASDGSVEAAFIGAWTAGVMNGVASKFGEPNSFGRAMSHAVAGCLSSAGSGGSCKSGALSAGFAEYAGPKNWGADAGLVTHAVLGGVGAELGGGKFKNGAMTGAYGYLFNYCAHNDCKIASNGMKIDPILSRTNHQKAVTILAVSGVAVEAAGIMMLPTPLAVASPYVEGVGIGLTTGSIILDASTENLIVSATNFVGRVIRPFSIASEMVYNQYHLMASTYFAAKSTQ